VGFVHDYTAVQIRSATLLFFCILTCYIWLIYTVAELINARVSAFIYLFKK